MTIKLKRKDLIYPELCYKIIGILFEIYRQIGGDYQKKHYQRAIAIEFKNLKIQFKEQVPFIVKYKNNKIGKYYLDFLIENKIILEIKKGNYFSIKNVKQISGYLKATNLKLGILANFTSSGLKFKRIVNIK